LHGPPVTLKVTVAEDESDKAKELFAGRKKANKTAIAIVEILKNNFISNLSKQLL